MNKYNFFGLFLLFSGLVLLILGLIQSEVQGGIIIVFPVIIADGIFPVVGIIGIFFGMILLFFGATNHNLKKNNDIESINIVEKKANAGGLILIGPIPIMIGSNWKISILLLVLAIIVILVFYIAVF